jgi:NADPH2:quinone reductase
VTHAFPSVDTEFLQTVDAGRRRREHFTNPIGRDGEVRGIWHGRHSCAPPAREVRDHNVTSEMQFRLVENPPPAWAAAAAVIGRPDFPAENRRRDSVSRCGPWRHVQLAIDDLADDVLGQREQVVVGRGTAGGIGRRHQRDDSTRAVIRCSSSYQTNQTDQTDQTHQTFRDTILGMKAIVVREFGAPEYMKIEKVPEPAPAAGQIVVRLHAAGVNPYDTYMLSGNYATRPPLPYTPGADAAGLVDHVGAGVANVKAGDRVYIGGTATHRSYGAYAEKAVCEPHQVHPLPDRLSFAQGAAINVPYVTAWHALHNRARLQPGETVFIHGASGGVGLAATQIARAWGARVIGTAGTNEGLALVRQQGAAHALNHREAGYLDRLKELTGGRGPNVILESLANVNLDNDLTAAAPAGRIVVIGNRGRTEIDARKTMGKDLSVYGMSMWNIPGTDLERIHAALVAGFSTCALSPVVGAELPLGEASRALTLVMEPGARGKIVLIP